MTDEKYNSHQKLLEMNFQKSADKSNTSSGVNLFGSARRITGERVTKAQRREEKYELSRE